MVKKLQITQMVIVMLFVMFTEQANGQKIVFDKMVSPNGGTYGFVSGIAQDINGVMWFSTKQGLFSYNGNQVTPYLHDPLNNNSPQSNFLETVFADSNGTIWIGSLGEGLDRFDPITGIFSHFRRDPNNTNSLSNDTVTSILRDKQGILWVGTHGGLDKFLPEENKFIHYRYDANDSTSISSNQVRRIFEDSKGNLWIGSGSPYLNDGGGLAGGGLSRFNKNTNTFTRFLHDPDNAQGLMNNKISAIYEDNDGVLWIGTGSNGVHRFNQKTETIERMIFDPTNPEELGGPETNSETPLTSHITFFTQDAKGHYWIGTSQDGVFHYNVDNYKMINFSETQNTSSGFNEYGVWSTYNSRDGVLWIGTSNTGNIYRFNPLKKEFSHSVVPFEVNDVYEDSKQNIWIATEQNLIIKNVKDGSTREFTFPSISGADSEKYVQNIKEDKQGNIWVGAGGGLFLWDKDNEKFIPFNNDPKNNRSLSNNEIVSIYEDNAENLWIATINGFNLYDKETKLFTRYYVDKTDTVSIERNIITSLLRDRNDNFWVGTWNTNGIHLYDLKNNTTKSYLKGANVTCVFEDHSGEIWVGIDNGLLKYDRQIDEFTRYNDSGLSQGITMVLGIVEDKHNYLWISGTKEIVRINPERNESSRFGKSYGISDNQMMWNSNSINKEGDIFFGTTSGYFKINPSDLMTNNNQPVIHFSNFRLADQPVIPGNSGPLKEELSKTKEIRLQHDQNVFSIDFNIIDYANPQDNHLIYFLKNYDKNWIQASSERRAYYFNIPPGQYTLLVKGSNSYGMWAEKSIDFIILPPWYRSTLAYGFYALLFITLVFGLDRIQRRRLLLLEKKKAQKRELQHAREIEKAYTELKATQTQLIQAEKMASLGELTAGIAHEIQNPLNFVNNFSEVNKELLEELNEELETGNLDEVKLLAKDVIDNEEKINYHGKRADAIVKGMLQHSRSSSGVKEPTDINALADEYLRLAYHGLRAKDKSFNASMNTNFDENLTPVNVIPQDIGRVILNLITNAFYAVKDKKKEQPKNYEPTVSVSTKKEKNKVIISVKDNGNGIPQAALDKIFQPFFTTKPTGEGTGLGLSMSYEIITKAHNGELKVDNHPGEGATFTIILPV